MPIPFTDLDRPINSSKNGRGVSSGHPDGVNVALFDARIVFIKNDVSPQVLKNLADRRDGAPIDLGGH